MSIRVYHARAGLLIVGALIASACDAQAPQKQRVLSNEQMTKIENIIHIGALNDRCPFSKQISDQFNFLTLVIGMEIPLTKTEFEELYREANARVDSEFGTSKDLACQRGEEQVLQLGSQLRGRLESVARAAEPAAPKVHRDVLKVQQYRTVAEALDGLDATFGVTVRPMPNGGTEVIEPGSAHWWFVPAWHYAYPAVVRTELIEPPAGKPYSEVRVLCEADKESCESFAQQPFPESWRAKR